MSGVLFLSLFSCSETNNEGVVNPSKVSSRRYGLNPMSSSDWENVSRYNSNITSRVGTISEVLPKSCLLLNPGIRDQGQIGSCTGFCGTETNEILKYYKANAIAPITGFTTSLGASKATSSVFTPTLLSPLFCIM